MASRRIARAERRKISANFRRIPRRGITQNQMLPGIIPGMHASRWLLFAGLTGYCGDVVLFGGVHANATIALMRHVAHGILLGLLRFA
jgi:hypothetical protein